MGLENNNSATFLSIGDGKITKRVKQPTDKSVTRTTKEGKVVHEEIYDAIAGWITDIKTQEHPNYGRFWNIYLKDDDGSFILQMNYSGGYASAFLKLLPNVDLTSPVRIIPTMKIEDNKKKVGLFITQHGTPLKHYFNKDNPNGLPPLEKIKVKKNGKTKEEWDDNEMMIFLENMVNTQILPKLKKSIPVTVYEPAKKAAVAVNVQEEEDNIPF